MSSVHSLWDQTGQLSFMFEPAERRGPGRLFSLSEGTEPWGARPERASTGTDRQAGGFLGRAALTRREAQVIDLIVAGNSNKQIAYRLAISPRTVEFHRAQLMRKMGARNLATLVRAALAS